MIDLSQPGDPNEDGPKRSWDFPPPFDGGPWPDSDPRWRPFLERMGMTLEQFKQLPVYKKAQ